MKRRPPEFFVRQHRTILTTQKPNQRYHTNRRTIKYRFPATNHQPPDFRLVNVRFTPIPAPRRAIYVRRG